MVESIKSGEIFPNAVATYSGDPKHTADGHERCAFYPTTEPIAEDVAAVIFIDMECPHGTSATGGFYSEGYVRQLKHHTHLLLEFFDELESHFKRQGDRTHINTYMTNVTVDVVKSVIEQARELTK